MRGRPETWAKLRPMPDPMGTIVRDLEAAVSRARGVGIDKTRMVIDPGFGFGKRKEQNSLILGAPGRTGRTGPADSGGPLAQELPGPPDTDGERASPPPRAVTACVLGGATSVRVHDVREMRAAADVADEILRCGD